jgi:hypothetical protein
MQTVARKTDITGCCGNSLSLYLLFPFTKAIAKWRTGFIPMISTDNGNCFGGLPSSMSAVNTEITPCHEAAGVAEEEHGSTAIFLGDAESLKHVLLGPLLFPFGVIIE